MTTRADIVTQVRDLVDPDSWPQLADDEIGAAVDAAARTDSAGNAPGNVTSTAWVTATAYTAGTLVYEAGRYWRCVVAGTSGATEPGWPTLTGYPATGTLLADNGVVWQDTGGAWAGEWDVPFAVARAWQMKASKVAGAHDFATDGQTFDRAQVHKHCLEQADRYLSQRAFVA